jgi:hypothetical protein
MMQAYRLYPLDKKGKIAGFPFEFLADSDERALQLSAEKLEYFAGELWRGAQRISQLSSVWETQIVTRISTAA